MADRFSVVHAFNHRDENGVDHWVTRDNQDEYLGTLGERELKDLEKRGVIRNEGPIVRAEVERQEAAGESRAVGTPPAGTPEQVEAAAEAQADANKAADAGIRATKRAGKEK